MQKLCGWILRASRATKLFCTYHTYRHHRLSLNYTIFSGFSLKVRRAVENERFLASFKGCILLISVQLKIETFNQWKIFKLEWNFNIFMEQFFSDTGLKQYVSASWCHAKKRIWISVLKIRVVNHVTSPSHVWDQLVLKGRNCFDSSYIQ